MSGMAPGFGLDRLAPASWTFVAGFANAGSVAVTAGRRGQSSGVEGPEGGAFASGRWEGSSVPVEVRGPPAFDGDANPFAESTSKIDCENAEPVLLPGHGGVVVVDRTPLAGTTPEVAESDKN